MNIALGVEYSGSNYCGWQRQSHSPSVQQNLEQVLSQIANHPVSVFCAGRTDTGVHATGQVVNFELKSERPLKAWFLGANTLLPDDISITWAQQMPSDFHARHSAFSRRYRYVIQNTRHRSATLSGKVTWVRDKLDDSAMNLSAQALLGEQNFASFQASSCQSPTPFRFVEKVGVFRWHDYVIVDIAANAFLHHMVRNIVGTLLNVGTGKQSVDYVAEVLSRQDRTQAPETAKPDGLYLVDVGYPDEFSVPESSLGPLLLPDNLSTT
ncbi:tRNA pseudouridine(38-40) synthase TruA [Aliikangiella coralliicola]|uniref:tRNA pseudouridine synthase A n=1 Tax=Aliikangiella coralliicola TaxID=2592383 RepID=A0A545U0H7_9GAMM|nr:tRNA pseudouridine(38-40) synthase TruA [Aliikangiella coralliicola]TQV82971.1 tRNA pseudouridine(38-40) synthase TruA [Aliikangiella coralliicola]